jgi:hypothetical protein
MVSSRGGGRTLWYCGIHCAQLFAKPNQSPNIHSHAQKRAQDNYPVSVSLKKDT